jgi:tRNA(Ile)-lysidine synthase
LRHQVLPILERQIQPAVVAHLSRLAARSREDEGFWKAMTAMLLGSLLERGGSRLRIRCADLLNPYSKHGVFLGSDLPEEARSAVSQRLVREIISELRGHRRQLTADHVERVVRMAASGSSGSRVELPGVIVERCFECLWFSRAKEATSEYVGSLEGNREVSRSFSRVVTLGNPGESTLVAVPEIKRRFHLKVVDWHLLGSDTEVDQLALDKDLLQTPLVLRNWRHGDSFRPKGRRSSRKLKQFFGMKRVAVPDREGWPVLTSADRLVWTRDFLVAADFAAGAATRVGVIVSEEKF